MQANTLAGKRILIAEDEPVIAMDHAAQLVRAGAKIVAACTTVQGAVDCLGDTLPYIIVYRVDLGDTDELVILGIFHGAQDR